MIRQCSKAFIIAHVTRISTTIWGEGYIPEDTTRCWSLTVWDGTTQGLSNADRRRSRMCTELAASGFMAFLSKCPVTFWEFCVGMGVWFNMPQFLSTPQHAARTTLVMFSSTKPWNCWVWPLLSFRWAERTERGQLSRTIKVRPLYTQRRDFDQGKTQHVI